MRIDTSQISMDASVDHKDVTGRVVQISNSQGERKPQFHLELPGTSVSSLQRVAENSQSQRLCASSLVECSGEEENYQVESDQVMERMVQELTGKRVHLRRIEGLEQGERVMLGEPVNPPGRPVPFTFESHSLQYEYESISVHSSGTVQLNDGRSVNFSMDLSMERESLVRESIAWQSASNILMDPLVLNFDCDLRGLENKKFTFDLDCDGKDDEICSLRPGTGFLALDLNNDQHITNGRELFGPSTGYGFAELALHDQDSNGWIDENDPVFDRLRIWKPGTNGESELVTLAEGGVGAICLSNMATSFQLKDRENQSMGEVAATGVFLTESGEVRPIQEIKFSLETAEESDFQLVSSNKKSEAIFFIEKMIALRSTELQVLAKLQRSRQDDERKRDLLSHFFLDSLVERNGLSG